MRRITTSGAAAKTANRHKRRAKLQTTILLIARVDIPPLKRYFSANLQIPRCGYVSIPRSECGALNVGNKVIQERVIIESVKGFTANLDVIALFDREILRNSKIEVKEAKAAQI
jgi:hypothetical protein